VSRTVKHLQAFVASPGDVSEERECLENVIRELNDSWSKELGIHLDLIRWETHAYPGISTDSQAVINQQIDDDYDIFIGIMWKRFGTPTESAGSGTEEEFDRAYKRFLDDQDSLKIMFYFKGASPVNLLDIDPDQLILVNKFKCKLEQNGVLYWTYNNLADFEQFIRKHLTRQLQEWRKTWSENELKTDKLETTETESLEEMGYLDLIELRDNNFEESRFAVERIAEAIAEFGKRLDARNSEVDKAVEKKNQRRIKQILDNVAEDMESFAKTLNRECSIFASLFSQGVNASSKIIHLYISFNPTDKTDLMDQKLEIQKLKDNFDDMLMKKLGLKSAMTNFPPMTTKINKAKKHLLSSLDTFDGEMTNAAMSLSDLIAQIETIAGESE